MEAKDLEFQSKAWAFQARWESKKAKTLFANEKIVAQRMRNLEKAKEIGIINEIGFKMNCAELLAL